MGAYGIYPVNDDDMKGSGIDLDGIEYDIGDNGIYIWASNSYNDMNGFIPKKELRQFINETERLLNDIRNKFNIG